MLRKMKEFKRGIHQLEWENKKCEMEVSVHACGVWRLTGRLCQSGTYTVEASTDVKLLFQGGLVC